MLTAKKNPPTIILSFRGCHTDSLPAKLVQETLKYFKNNLPSIPVTLCFEGDPNINLDQHIDNIKTKCDYGISRFPGKPYEHAEKEHDLAVFWLLKTARVFKTNFILSDLPGINEIPIGDPRATTKRSERETKMAEALINMANTTGGIVIDFGGINHTSPIQQLLKKSPKISDPIETHFYCVYSAAAQSEIPAQLSLLQFQSPEKPSQLYPYGLEFLTTSLQDEHILLNSFTNKLKEFVKTQLNKNTEATPLIIPAYTATATTSSTATNTSLEEKSHNPTALEKP